MNLPNCPLELNSPDLEWRRWLRDLSPSQMVVVKQRLNQYALKHDNDSYSNARILRILEIARDERDRIFDALVEQVSGMSVAPKRERVKIGQPLLG